MSSDPARWGIGDHRAAARDVASATEIVERVLERLTAAPPGILIGSPLEARAHADLAALVDRDPAALPLFGVPFAVKDNVDVAGVPTTAGCPGATTEPDRDATVVARLRAAGAVLVAKTNLDQFATGLVGTRSPYGTPRNALDPALVPGGSSSGSAVAVALGLVPFALGTDTAGSGRVPAALNGIVGVKPTLGSASTAGIVPAVRRLDCPSVFARSVADGAAVAALLRAHDPSDPWSRHAPPASPPRSWPLRVGVPGAWPAAVGLDPLVERHFASAVDRLAALGLVVATVDIEPAIALGAMLYGSPLVAERTAAVGELVAKGVDGLDPTVAAIIARGAEYTAVDAYRAEYELAELRARVALLWEQIDVLALPATPTLVTLAAVERDPFGANEAIGRLTTFVNLADAACVTLPAQPGTPFGLQLVGPAWSDDRLATVAEAYEWGVAPEPEAGDTLVVVGAHLEGLALNHQLTSRGATLVRRTTTSRHYRLHALGGTTPPKPGLQRVPAGGAEIAVEVWRLDRSVLGSFLDEVPPPLAIGSVELSDGSWHRGFVCEPIALDGATDITILGGWRAYLAATAGGSG